MFRNQLITLVFVGLITACGTHSESPASLADVQPQTTVTIKSTLAATALPSMMPQPSATAQPTQTIAPTKTKKGLGISRHVLQSKFQEAPFAMSFKDVPQKNGETVKGNSDAMPGVDVLLVGSTKDVQAAQVSAIMDGKTASGDVLRAMIALLEITVPSIDNPLAWLEPRLKAAIDNESDTSTEAGREISLIAAKNVKVIILIVRPEKE